MMLVLQIAAGIVLAAIILALLPYILGAGVVVIVVGAAIAAIAFLFLYPDALFVVVGFVGVVMIVYLMARAYRALEGRYGTELVSSTLVLSYVSFLVLAMAVLPWAAIDNQTRYIVNRAAIDWRQILTSNEFLGSVAAFVAMGIWWLFAIRKFWRLWKARKEGKLAHQDAA